jgi:hypothetical protein
MTPKNIKAWLKFEHIVKWPTRKWGLSYPNYTFLQQTCNRFITVRMLSQVLIQHILFIMEIIKAVTHINRNKHNNNNECGWYLSDCYVTKQKCAATFPPSWSKDLEKLIVVQLIKEFLTFHKTGLINVFGNGRHIPYPNGQSQIILPLWHQFYCFPSKPRSPTLCFHFILPYKNSEHISHLCQ